MEYPMDHQFPYQGPLDAYPGPDDAYSGPMDSYQTGPILDPDMGPFGPNEMDINENDMDLDPFKGPEIQMNVPDNLSMILGNSSTWIFGATEDQIILPILLSLIGILAVLANFMTIFTILAFKRMRSGPNLMLLNISMSDLVFIAFCIPTSIMNHAVSREEGSQLTEGVCKFVHYVIFVTVYVGIYTLVITCIFRFFSEVLSARFMSLLSKSNAVISSVVIWIAFLVSHLNLLMQDDSEIFQEPFICVHTESLIDQTKMKTLWVTFLTCAFLLPLLTICLLSALIAHSQHLGDARRRDAYESDAGDRRNKRDLTMVIMAIMVVRTLCWVPVQIFVMIDVFGVTEMTDLYRKAEMLGVCCAFVSCCVNPIIYNCVSFDFRFSFQEVMACLFCKAKGEKPPYKDDGSDMNETIMSILSDSSNHINYG